MSERKSSYTNAELLFDACLSVWHTESKIIEIQSALDTIFGEKSKIVTDLADVLYDIGHLTEVLHNIGYHNPHFVDPQDFIDWVSDPRPYGLCVGCANRESTDVDGFHKCKLHGGTNSPDYGCYEYVHDDTPEPEDAE